MQASKRGIKALMHMRHNLQVTKQGALGIASDNQDARIKARHKSHNVHEAQLASRKARCMRHVVSNVFVRVKHKYILMINTLDESN